MPLEDLPTSTRPRTRAWVRAEVERNRQSLPTPYVKSKQNPTRQNNPSKPDTGKRNKQTFDRTKKKPIQPVTERVLRSKTNKVKGPSNETQNAKRVKQTFQNTSRRSREYLKKQFNTEAQRKGGPKVLQSHLSPQVKSRQKRNETKRTADVTSIGSEQTYTVSEWLRQVQPQGSENAERVQNLERLPNVDSYSLSSMGSRHASRLPTSESRSTITRRSKGGESSKIEELNSKIENRCIVTTPNPENEQWLSKNETIFSTVLPKVTKNQMRRVLAAVNDFTDKFDKSGQRQYHLLLTSLRLSLDEIAVNIKHPVIIPQYFDSMKKKSETDNEAVLQRTVMMSFFHQHWIGDDLEWNAEGLWNLPDRMRLPSVARSKEEKEDDKLSRPKPDLIIGFKAKCFSITANGVPFKSNNLKKAMRPDGSKVCFPFLIMEVKKMEDNTDSALLANLHTASQALYNIYNWFKRAGQTNKFFEKVRVFTLVFNAKTLGVRVHRAVRQHNKGLMFYFHELCPEGSYSRERACLTVNAILENYALKELKPVLSEAFEKVQKPREVPAQSDSASESEGESTPRARQQDESELEDDRGDQDDQDSVDASGKRRSKAPLESSRKRVKSPEQIRHTHVSGNFEETYLSE